MVVVSKPPTSEDRLTMTYEEYVDWADGSMIAEWVDGEVIVNMPPTTIHQQMLAFLLSVIRNFVEFYRQGEVIAAPFEMRAVEGGSAREPDILFVATENRHCLTDRCLRGPADLIVELISDDSVTRDRTDKFYEYQEAGVREYWIIDPRPGKKRADFWVLNEAGEYHPRAVDNRGIYRSSTIPGFWIDVNWLWQEELPDPIFTFAEIAGLPQSVVEALRAAAEQGPQQ